MASEKVQVLVLGRNNLDGYTTAVESEIVRLGLRTFRDSLGVSPSRGYNTLAKPETHKLLENPNVCQVYVLEGASAVGGQFFSALFASTLLFALAAPHDRTFLLLPVSVFEPGQVRDDAADTARLLMREGFRVYGDRKTLLAALAEYHGVRSLVG
jgi:hypothetical protein